MTTFSGIAALRSVTRKNILFSYRRLSVVENTAGSAGHSSSRLVHADNNFYPPAGVNCVDIWMILSQVVLPLCLFFYFNFARDLLRLLFAGFVLTY
ncbi:hypothetical protein [Klebsiella variicola]|uniref:hypothetical protein n=1 Tax=Klebsiella variicola TaxID=244366 RepID=UPI001146DE9A|nr:hypothetical protein [Klebsiella variicola]